MPNHISTVVTVTGPESAVADFIARHITKITDGRSKGEDWFDFDTIIPMPQSIKDTSRPTPWDPDYDQALSVGDFEVELRAQAMVADGFFPGPRFSWMPETLRMWSDVAEWLDERTPAAKAWALKACAAAAETGHGGWHSWSVAHWGTKWSAYDYGHRERADGRFVFKFETAWSPPEPVLRKVSEMHPTLQFAIESIDEGGGEYAGAFKAGEGDLPRVGEDPERFRRVMQREPYGDEDEEPEAACPAD